MDGLDSLGRSNLHRYNLLQELEALIGLDQLCQPPVINVLRALILAVCLLEKSADELLLKTPRNKPVVVNFRLLSVYRRSG